MSSSCALLFIWWPRFIARIFPLCREPLFLFCPSFFAFPCLFSAVALYFFSSSSPRAPCLDFCFFFSFPSAIERQKIGLLRFLLAVWFVYSTFYFGRWIFYFLFIFMPVFSWFRNDRCQSTFLIFSPIFASSLLLHLFCVVYSSFRAMSQRRSIFSFLCVCASFSSYLIASVARPCSIPAVRRVVCTAVSSSPLSAMSDLPRNVVPSRAKTGFPTESRRPPSHSLFFLSPEFCLLHLSSSYFFWWRLCRMLVFCFLCPLSVRVAPIPLSVGLYLYFVFFLSYVCEIYHRATFIGLIYNVFSTLFWTEPSCLHSIFFYQYSNLRFEVQNLVVLFFGEDGRE